MKTIAISNQKGGVGKTTTAVPLSVALARQGKRVLLIDADSQADATKYLGVENPDELQNTLSTAMHCIINALPYKTGEYIQSHPEGLDFVPSSIDLSSVEVELVNAMSRERILKTFLDDIRRAYDYALIDCQCVIGSRQRTDPGAGTILFHARPASAYTHHRQGTAAAKPASENRGHRFDFGRQPHESFP